MGGAAILLWRPKVLSLTALNFYPWEGRMCSLYPLIKSQKWTMQSAPKHEWVLFILRSSQALWKLALEHGSKWNWHHRPNENWIPYIQLSPGPRSFSSVIWMVLKHLLLLGTVSSRLTYVSRLPPPAWLEMRAPTFSSPFSIPLWGLAPWNTLTSVQGRLSFCLCSHLYLYCYL